MHTATVSSYGYDFRRDFDSIARPGLIRYLKHLGFGVDLEEGDDPNDFDLTYYTEAKRYSRRLWRALDEAQEFSPEAWSLDSAIALANTRLGDMLGATEDQAPVDIDRAVRLGTEMVRKQNASGNLPFVIETGSEAVVYATDRLKSKIERNACGNPISEVHAGFLSYRFLKEMRAGEKVLYIDHYKRRQAEHAAGPEEAKDDEASKSMPDAKFAECMFQRVGLPNSQPREYIVKGLIPRNEVCNPFGRPDSFKGVTAAQIAVHIAGGVNFLGLEVKQGPTGYFAAERGDQAKRRIKGHIQRLGLPSDLPCYFGGKPINLLFKPDLDFLIANIRAIERDAGAPLGFLVIDTQSRTMGGDENSTADGAAYAKAVEAIRQATDATLWIIAHTGHSEDAQDRPPGSSALLGAYDTFYRHKKTDERSGGIKITIDRDGLGEKELLFTVELYDTGAVNEDGEPVMVPYLEAAAAPAKFTFKKSDEPSKSDGSTRAESEALRALHKAIKKHGVVTPKGEGIPAGEVTVCEREWRDTYYDLFRTREQSTLRQGFSRATKGLVAKNLVKEYGSRRWAAE